MAPISVLQRRERHGDQAAGNGPGAHPSPALQRRARARPAGHQRGGVMGIAMRVHGCGGRPVEAGRLTPADRSQAIGAAATVVRSVVRSVGATHCHRRRGWNQARLPRQQARKP